MRFERLIWMSSLLGKEGGRERVEEEGIKEEEGIEEVKEKEEAKEKEVEKARRFPTIDAFHWRETV